MGSPMALKFRPWLALEPFLATFLGLWACPEEISITWTAGVDISSPFIHALAVSVSALFNQTQLSDPQPSTLDLDHPTLVSFESISPTPGQRHFLSSLSSTPAKPSAFLKGGLLIPPVPVYLLVCLDGFTPDFPGTLPSTLVSRSTVRHAPFFPPENHKTAVDCALPATECFFVPASGNSESAPEFEGDCLISLATQPSTRDNTSSYPCVLAYNTPPRRHPANSCPVQTVQQFANMPSKTKTQGAGADNDDGPIPIFNEKDLRFIRAVMENMDGRPDVDWAKVAEEYGDTKDDKQAKEKYRVLAIKFGWNGQTKSPATRHAKPTESDMRFVKAIFGNMTGKPDTDWEKVARDYGDTKDVKQAKEKYRVTAFKYGWVRKTPTKTAAKRASGPVSAAKATRSRDIEGTPGTVVAETTTLALLF